MSFALGGFARHKNDFKGAIYWYQNATELAVKNKEDLKASLASTILESVTNPSLFLTNQIDNETKNKINYCIELLSESWSEFKDSDLRKSRSWILINRGIAKKFLGNIEGAYEDIKQAKLESGNSYFAIRHLAIVAFEMDKLDQSLDLFDQLKRYETEDDKDEFNIDIFRSSVFHRKNDFKNAILTLKNILNEDISEISKVHAKGNLILAYLASDNINKAKELSYLTIEDHPKYLRGYIEASKVFIKLNDKKEALKILEQGFEYLNYTSSHVEIKEFAFQYSILEEHNKTIEILEPIINPEDIHGVKQDIINGILSCGRNR